MPALLIMRGDGTDFCALPAFAAAESGASAQPADSRGGCGRRRNNAIFWRRSFCRRTERFS